MKSESVKVTRKGHEMLLDRKQKFMEQLRAVQGQKGEAAEVGGNVWHDNFAFEDLVRQENMLNKQIADTIELLGNVEVVSGPVDEDMLAIGHVATLEFDDGTQKIIEVAGFGETDLSANPQKIEYKAPLIRPFIGQGVDFETRIAVGGRGRTVTLVNIAKKGG